MNVQIGDQWEVFISEIKRKANPNDESQIVVNDFVKSYRKFGAKLKPKELTAILKSFPGDVIGDHKERINVAKIYDMKSTKIMERVYNKIDTSNKIGADEPTDNLGYLGKS